MYRDTHPFKKGDTVRVRKGALTWYRGQRTVLGRSRTLTVNLSSVWLSRRNPCDATGTPTIVWPGSGGYWREADAADCEILAPEK